MHLPDEVLAAKKATDILLISYPRSGNTWLRLVLTTIFLLQRNRQAVVALEPEIAIGRMIPTLHDFGFVRKWQAHYETPPIFKSHTWFAADRLRAIYLFREADEALASYYHYAKELAEIPANYDANQFVRERFSEWQEHLERARQAHAEESSDLIFFTYKQLMGEPLPQLKRLLQWLGISATDKEIQLAIRLNSQYRSRRYLITANNSKFPMLTYDGSKHQIIDTETRDAIRQQSSTIYQSLLALTM